MNTIKNGVDPYVSADVDVSDLHADIATIDTNVDDINAHITANYAATEKSAIDLLDDASGGLADIHTDVGTAISDIASLDTVVDGVETKVDTAQGSLDDLTAELEVVETHEHSYLRWFGATVGQTAASHANPAVTTGLTAFSVTANATAATWGTAVEIYHGNEELDTKGTPAYLDLNQVFIMNVGKTGVWRLRFSHGDNAAGAAAAVTAQNYSGVVFRMTQNDADGEAIPIQTERIPVTDSIWVEAMSDQSTGGACTLLYALHSYNV